MRDYYRSLTHERIDYAVPNEDWLSRLLGRLYTSTHHFAAQYDADETVDFLAPGVQPTLPGRRINRMGSESEEDNGEIEEESEEIG